MIKMIRALLGLGGYERISGRQGARFVGVGYPKTGNTWTRIMLGQYCKTVYRLDHLPLFDADEMEALASKGYSGPLGTFTHQPLVWQGQTAKDLNYHNTLVPFSQDRVLFITRHPLDVLVSHYMHSKYKVPNAPYPGTLEDFIADPVQGLDKFLAFHNLWARHHGDVQDFLLWRYEDVRASPEVQLSKLLLFLGAEIQDSAVPEAVKFASFENLKAMESAGERLVYQSSGFNAFGDGPKDDPNAFHVRKGQVGGYRDEVAPEMVERLEARVRAEMPAMFGYC